MEVAEPERIAARQALIAFVGHEDAAEFSDDDVDRLRANGYKTLLTLKSARKCSLLAIGLLRARIDPIMTAQGEPSPVSSSVLSETEALSLPV